MIYPLVGRSIAPIQQTTQAGVGKDFLLCMTPDTLPYLKPFRPLLTMQTSNMTRAHASLELALWQAEAETVSSSDLYIWLRECGLPSEIAIRLKELVAVTKKIGAKLVSIGKVILLKLMEFIQKHPYLATGVALGAGVSALIAGIPFIGPILAPIAAVIGITVGAVIGHRMDKGHDHSPPLGIVELTQDVIEIAREFFQLFIDTAQALSDELQQS